ELRQQPLKRGAADDLVVGDYGVGPGLARAAGGMRRCGLAPLARRRRLCLYGRVIEFIAGFYLKDKHPGGRLDHEIGLIGFTRAVVDAELIAPWLEPFFDAS